MQSQAVTDTAVCTSACVCKVEAQQLHNLCEYSPIPQKTTQVVSGHLRISSQVVSGRLRISSQVGLSPMT